MYKSKSIFIIPLYYNSEKEYRKKWEHKFKTNYEIYENQYSDDQLKEFRNQALSLNPISHRFNDILGYAELIFDYPQILIQYHLNGDKRKRYNKNKWYVNSKNKIYEAVSHSHGGSIRIMENDEFRNGISEALREVESQCGKWKVFVDILSIKEKIRCFDFKQYLID